MKGVLVDLKNDLQLQTAGTATLNGADPLGFRIKHGMARALAVPFHSFNLQHFKAIITLFTSARLAGCLAG